MAYANLHSDDHQAMPESSFICIVLPGKQTNRKDTRHGGKNSHDVSKAAASLPQAGGKAMACQSINQEDKKCKLID